MNKHESTCKYNIAETCCHSLSINELVSLSENQSIQPSDLIDLSSPQTYGEIRGTSTLRSHLSRLYSSSGQVTTPLSPEAILITPGAIAANHLVLSSLVRPGDHVIVQYPTYQQLYSIPASLGAHVSLWKCDPSNTWLPDLAHLATLVQESTTLIILNTPQNPTGQILPKSLLRTLVDFAKARNLTVVADEVYRPIFHGIGPVDSEFPPSLLSLGYNNTVVTGSLSKAYSLAGIRVGWIASRNPELVEQFAQTRDYTTISVSRMDQEIAAFALSPETIHALLGRNIQLAKTNVALLEKWIIKHDEFASWEKPVAGTTAFVKFERDGKRIDAQAFCRHVQEKTGVMLLPGDVGFGEEFKGYVRFGFVCDTQVLKDALEALRVYMRKEYDDVPLCE